jgi:hypothetical protein
LQKCRAKKRRVFLVKLHKENQKVFKKRHLFSVTGLTSQNQAFKMMVEAARVRMRTKPPYV